MLIAPGQKIGHKKSQKSNEGIMKNIWAKFSTGIFFLYAFNLFASDLYISFGVASKKSRDHQVIEDRYSVKKLAPYFNTHKQCKTDTFFGVFDGHGSNTENDKVSDLLAKELPILIAAKLGPDKNLAHVKEAINDSIIQLDNYSRELLNQGSTAVFGLLLDDSKIINNQRWRLASGDVSE